MARAALRVGTSGWQYRDWRGPFYDPALPARSWLTAYARSFTTCEVNNTFYRLPDRDTFVRWADAVPADFRFAVKASRYLTHVKRLQEPEQPVERLLQMASGLGERLEVVLVQLPPNLPRDDDRLAACLAAFGARVRVAVEFRHPSWFDPAVYAVLRENDSALGLTDRGSRPATPVVRTATWCYLRMHAGRARPEPCYGTAALDAWIARLVHLYGRDVAGSVFFNNDPHACAPRDAGTFRRRAGRAGVAAV